MQRRIKPGKSQPQAPLMEDQAGQEEKDRIIARQRYLIGLMAEYWGLANYVGTNYDLAPDRMQEIIRVWRRLYPEEEEK